MNLPDPERLAAMRQNYGVGKLRRADMLVDPLEQFDVWFKQAVDAGLTEPNAMSLATSGADGRPLVRTVLLKGLDARGLVFFTNLESRKARQIAENPQVSMLFPWIGLERQVIICGAAARLSVAESLKYFLSRPRDSQLAAWASNQSRVIESRKLLEMEWEHLKHKFGSGEIPLPTFWGGYRVSPVSIEFWQGGPNRLHDRLEYTRLEAGGWKLERLSP